MVYRFKMMLHNDQIHIKSNSQSIPSSPIILELMYCCSTVKIIRQLFFHFSIALKLNHVGNVQNFFQSTTFEILFFKVIFKLLPFDDFLKLLSKLVDSVGCRSFLPETVLVVC